MTIAARADEFSQIEAAIAAPDMPARRAPMLTKLYDAAVRGMSQPELLSDDEIQKICYVFAARCFAAGVSMSA